MNSRPTATTRWRQFAPHLHGTTAGMVPSELLAGATIAAIAVPQAIAYAFVAGLPPQMGLIAAALPCALAALSVVSAALLGYPLPIGLLQKKPTQTGSTFFVGSSDESTPIWLE